MKNIMIAIFVICLVHAKSKEDVQKFLAEGNYKQGEVHLENILSENPENDRARLGLAALQFFRAFSNLSDDLYRYGLRNRYLAREFQQDFMLPLKSNPNPQPISYKDFRNIVENWKNTLQLADMNLQKIKDETMQLEINLSQALFRFFMNLRPNISQNELDAMQKQAAIVIHFDIADAHWLRGYCNIFMAAGEAFLAYDHRELFEAVGHLFFADVVSEHKLIGHYKANYGFSRDLIDAIAFIHGFSFQLKEPQRMLKSLYHLETFIAQGRKSWECILREKDTDHFEWVPNPQQQSFMPVEQKMIDGWLEVLNELESILKGKKLVPFWINRDYGINVRKVFTQPQKFDLIMWIHGSGVVRYVEKGSISDERRWRDLTEVFGRDFFTYMFWFN
ncbi:tetratricopeptide repeat protein [Candidatus Uabimicrobium amorphum]|uniref:Tetratricopeptide repeat protein n=1 Tax=Uabimicrobium amorphum TaxID=2596890 RepID=A0A5S9IPU9_UABAM|nr:tetratricopeptide repeat protein [Candidatus Uabimicrobium amorphum]BBM85480.1 hypothetical protein UABAM_03849 [Candidatus Uabimicrobium amorphum]